MDCYFTKELNNNCLFNISTNTNYSRHMCSLAMSNKHLLTYIGTIVIYMFCLSWKLVSLSLSCYTVASCNTMAITMRVISLLVYQFTSRRSIISSHWLFCITWFQIRIPMKAESSVYKPYSCIAKNSIGFDNVTAQLAEAGELST